MEIQDLEMINLYEYHHELKKDIFAIYQLYSDDMSLNLFQNYSIEFHKMHLGIVQLIAMKVICAERISKVLLGYLYGFEEKWLNSTCSLSRIRAAFYQELRTRFSDSPLYQKAATRLSLQFYLWIVKNPNVLRPII